MQNMEELCKGNTASVGAKAQPADADDGHHGIVVGEVRRCRHCCKMLEK
jgi:hypothetical protein